MLGDLHLTPLRADLILSVENGGSGPRDGNFRLYGMQLYTEVGVGLGGALVARRFCWTGPATESHLKKGAHWFLVWWSSQRNSVPSGRGRKVSRYSTATHTHSQSVSQTCSLTCLNQPMSRWCRSRCEELVMWEHRRSKTLEAYKAL